MRLSLENRPENRERNWLQLFDLLCKQSTLNTAQEALDLSPSFRTKKNLTQQASILRDHVLAALRDYYAATMPENKLLRKIEDLQILLRKGQYQLADKILSAAWKEAKTLSWNPYWYKLAQIEAFLLRLKYSGDQLNESLNQLEQRTALEQDRLSNTVRYNLMATNMYARITAGAQSPEAAAALAQLTSNPLLTDFPETGSMESQMRYHEIRGTIAFHQQRFKDSVEERRALVELFSAEPRRIAREPIRYIVMLNNLIISAMSVDDYEEVRIWLTRMRALPDTHKITNRENIALTAFSNSYSNEIYYLLNRVQYERVQEIIPEITKGLQRFKGKLPSEYVIDFDYQLARAFFELKDFGRCLDYVTPVISNWPVSFRTSQQLQGRILYMLAQLELANYRLLESSLLNFRRFAAQAKVKNKVITLLLRTLKKINYQPDPAVKRPLIGNLRADLEDLADSGGHKLFMLECGITAWLNSWQKES